MTTPTTRGVYVLDADGSYGLVHAFDDDDEYGLLDIVEFLELGEIIDEGETQGLELDGRELARIATLAHESEGDHPPGFIALCDALAAIGATAPGEPFHFYAFR